MIAVLGLCVCFVLWFVVWFGLVAWLAVWCLLAVWLGLPLCGYLLCRGFAVVVRVCVLNCWL